MSPTKINQKEAKKRYSSVQAMVKDISEDKEFAERVAGEIEERNVINHLMATRAALGLSQKDIANKMKCSQSRISKLESGKDNDLRIGDFHEYLEAMGFQLALVIAKKGKPSIAQRVHRHMTALRKVFNELAELARDDDAIQRGTFKYFVETSCAVLTGLGNLAKEVLAKLPKGRNKEPVPIQIEVQTDEPEELSFTIPEEANT